MEEYKKFVKVEYELQGYNGYILVSEEITDEKQIRKMCLQDYLENYLEKEIKILKKESN